MIASFVTYTVFFINDIFNDYDNIIPAATCKMIKQDNIADSYVNRLCLCFCVCVCLKSG